ncbi:MAG: hypothetical protein SFX18_20080, partial [Pirellulales bacterium]|nr:hypothetical protein [Pirellulales bacterium]
MSDTQNIADLWQANLDLLRERNPKLSVGQAVAKLVKEQPLLHQQFLAAANARQGARHEKPGTKAKPAQVAWESALEALTDKGMPRARATAHLAKTRPELRSAYVAEHNEQA